MKLVAGVVSCLVFGLWSALPCAAVAASYADPTRPPMNYGAADVGAPSDISGPVLQSVIVGPRETSAIINGQTVKVGSRFGEAKVVRITETEVHLSEGRDVQVLKLFPNIEKRVSARGSGDDRLRRQRR